MEGTDALEPSGKGYEVIVTESYGPTAEVRLDGSFNLDDHNSLGG